MTNIRHIFTHFRIKWKYWTKMYRLCVCVFTLLNMIWIHDTVVFTEVAKPSIKIDLPLLFTDPKNRWHFIIHIIFNNVNTHTHKRYIFVQYFHYSHHLLLKYMRKVTCICVLWLSILPLSTIFFIEFWKCSECDIFLFYILFIINRHFQQYFSYIVAISFIGGGSRSTRRKRPTCRK
jgi:hypothetical protein